MTCTCRPPAVPSSFRPSTGSLLLPHPQRIEPQHSCDTPRLAHAGAHANMHGRREQVRWQLVAGGLSWAAEAAIRAAACRGRRRCAAGAVPIHGRRGRSRAEGAGAGCDGKLAALPGARSLAQLRCGVCACLGRGRAARGDWRGAQQAGGGAGYRGALARHSKRTGSCQAECTQQPWRARTGCAPRARWMGCREGQLRSRSETCCSASSTRTASPDTWPAPTLRQATARPAAERSVPVAAAAPAASRRRALRKLALPACSAHARWRPWRAAAQ